jgi:hypothetical protein
MKTSRRLLFGTFLVTLLAPVVLVAFSRVNGGSMAERPAPERPTPAELTSLRDFSNIEVRGDFNLELTSAPDYSVEYVPLAAANQGFLRASVTDGTLLIEGYANRTEFGASTVRIGLPDLDRLDAESLASLVVRNFDTDAMELRVGSSQDIVIENNRIDALQLELQQTQNVDLRGNTIGTTSVRHFGTTITSD